jgi:hypothetical protein
MPDPLPRQWAEVLHIRCRVVMRVITEWRGGIKVLVEVEVEEGMDGAVLLPASRQRGGESSSMDEWIGNASRELGQLLGQ